MTKFLNLFVVLAQLFPAVLTFIRELENAFPQAGQGAAKLALLREMLEKAYVTIGDVTVRWAELWPLLEALIAKIVALANSLGVFPKPKSTPMPVSNDDPS